MGTPLNSAKAKVEASINGAYGVSLFCGLKDNVDGRRSKEITDIERRYYDQRTIRACLIILNQIRSEPYDHNTLSIWHSIVYP